MEERGQGTVEWVGLVAVVALLLTVLVAAGVRVPGADLARALASRILCAATLADSCGDEPALIAAYGTEVGKLVRERMPSLAFERGSRALPVDFRRCRRRACSDGSARGLVRRSDAGLPVTAFVRVVDCRSAGADGDGPGDRAVEAAGRPAPSVPDCSGGRAGNLYVQYWLYFPDSATMRGVPVLAAAGYHRDDWESVQLRIGPDGRVDQRASSHRGYNHLRGLGNVGSEAGIDSLDELAEATGARARGGWGPRSGLLLVSGGSHAGNGGGFLHVDRLVPGRSVHLVPLEPIAAAAGNHRFAVSPPWRKRAWLDPEAESTG